jgi:hypothetical protein
MAISKEAVRDIIPGIEGKRVIGLFYVLLMKQGNISLASFEKERP